MGLGKLSAWVSWLAAVCLLPSSLFAIGDEWRGDAKWEEQKPNGEKGVPGFYMNLGPTGLRARLRDLSFEVKYVFADSPSAGKVQTGDVITGVNGRPFTIRHSFGFDWKVAKHGYEGPMMDLGNAIEESEGKDGVLTLKVKRGEQELDVKLQLRPLGSFSSTFPYECKKSDQLFREICEDLARTEKTWLGSWRHISVSAGLALLASGDPKYLPICKRVAESAKQVNPTEAGGLNNWSLTYSGIYLSEYYLITHDASVLPALEKIHKGFVFAQVEPGSYQHQKNWGGYPELGIMVALINTTWALMDKCGVEFDLEPYEMTRKRVRWLTRKDGAVIYGRESKPGWEKEPMVLDGGRGPYEDSGRGGAAMMGYYLSGHGEPKADEYCRKVGGFLTEYKEYFPDTHACPGVGIQWMGLGLACGYPEGFRKVMDYHKGYFNLMRGYAPGQFFALPCRSNACDLNYPRQFTSAVVGLLLAVKERKLQITGAPLKACRLGGCVTEKAATAGTSLSGSGAKPLAALSVPGGAAATTPGANGGTPTGAATPAAAVRLAVSPEVLGQWQARFVEKLNALAKGGVRLKVDLGDNQNYVLRSASEASLIVSAQGSDLPMPWRLLSPTYRAALAKGAATDDDVEALLIAAVMQLACNQKEQADELFAKAALKDAEAVKVAKATLSK